MFYTFDEYHFEDRRKYLHLMNIVLRRGLKRIFDEEEDTFPVYTVHLIKKVL